MNPSQQSQPTAGGSVEASKDEKKSEETGKIRKPRFKRIEHKYPVEPRVIQVIKKPKTFMDHSYRDFSIVPPEPGYVHPTKIEDMNFAQKVFAMLSDETISNWMHWVPHGRCFKIAVPKRLEQSKTLQRYFGHNRYSSFLRQLNNYGFKHLSKGPDRNCYYHECMLRGMPHLTKYMPPGRDARRLMADPDNEPDFYSIDRLFPLPSGNSNKVNMNFPLMGIGGQSQLNPLFGGMSNFQQLPPGFLGNNNQGLGQINQIGSSEIPQGLSLPPLQQQQQALLAPGNSNPFAALLQQQQQPVLQQQQMQQQSSSQQQRAQSSLMPFM
uniref:HSF-type DNA-binding domain-containing protein n=1 Tax=Amphora coffeiformis TaxID=265554 RepID=A0A7S3LFR8_9STRA